MKWKPIALFDRLYIYRTNWHKWFAWYPVYFEGYTYWLAIVERKCNGDWYYPECEYREVRR